MTITVGSVTLNDHVSWRGRWNQGVPGSERVTLGNVVVVNRLSGQANPDVVLEAREEDNVRKGYYTQAQIEALIVYRDAGTVLSINYHGIIFTAIIKIDGIQVQKTLWQSTFTADERYVGSITFKRVT